MTRKPRLSRSQLFGLAPGRAVRLGHGHWHRSIPGPAWPPRAVRAVTPHLTHRIGGPRALAARAGGVTKSGGIPGRRPVASPSAPRPGPRPAARWVPLAHDAASQSHLQLRNTVPCGVLAITAWPPTVTGIIMPVTRSHAGDHNRFRTAAAVASPVTERALGINSIQVAQATPDVSPGFVTTSAGPGWRGLLWKGHILEHVYCVLNNPPKTFFFLTQICVLFGHPFTQADTE